MKATSCIIIKSHAFGYFICKLSQFFLTSRLDALLSYLIYLKIPGYFFIIFCYIFYFWDLKFHWFFDLNSCCRDLMNEGIFDIVTDVLQSQDKKLVLTGYWSPLFGFGCSVWHSLQLITKRQMLWWLQNRYPHSFLESRS